MADRTLLMTRPTARFGHTHEVLTVENLRALFDIDMLRLPGQHQGQHFDSIVPVYETLVTSDRPGT